MLLDKVQALPYLQFNQNRYTEAALGINLLRRFYGFLQQQLM